VRGGRVMAREGRGALWDWPWAQSSCRSRPRGLFRSRYGGRQNAAALQDVCQRSEWLFLFALAVRGIARSLRGFLAPDLPSPPPESGGLGLSSARGPSRAFAAHRPIIPCPYDRAVQPVAGKSCRRARASSGLRRSATRQWRRDFPRPLGSETPDVPQAQARVPLVQYDTGAVRRATVRRR